MQFSGSPDAGLSPSPYMVLIQPLGRGRGSAERPPPSPRRACPLRFPATSALHPEQKVRRPLAARLCAFGRSTLVASFQAPHFLGALSLLECEKTATRLVLFLQLLLWPWVWAGSMKRGQLLAQAQLPWTVLNWKQSQGPTLAWGRVQFSQTLVGALAVPWSPPSASFYLFGLLSE